MKKPKPSDVSIQDIRMIDWYAAFILMRLSSFDSDAEWTAREVFDRAEEMMKERTSRIGVLRQAEE